MWNLRFSHVRSFVVAACLIASWPWAIDLRYLLTGIVSDSSGAVVPGANVTLKNAGSGDVRKTVANSDGYFTVSSVRPEPIL